MAPIDEETGKTENGKEPVKNDPFVFTLHKKHPLNKIIGLRFHLSRPVFHRKNA